MKPRFSIRGLFSLALMVALAVGWWLDHQAMSRKLHDADISERLATAKADVAEFDLKLRAKADQILPPLPPSSWEALQRKKP